MSDFYCDEMTLQPAVPRTPHGLVLPPLACDCHTHVFGPHDRFPLWSGRSYSPPEASIAQLLALQQALGFQRVVIVHPSVYGTDNRVTVDALRQLGGRARGVAVVEPDVDHATLVQLHEANMCGIRLNLMTAGEGTAEETQTLVLRMAEAVQPFGWHIQMFARLETLTRLAPILAELPVRVSIDHFGWAQAAEGADQAGVAMLCDLLRGGNVYLKLSGAHRVSALGAADPALDGIARRLTAANPHRLVWGTDWPHPGAFVPGQRPGEVNLLHDIDDGLGLQALGRWAGDVATLKLILVDNPAELYGFPATALQA